MPALPFVIIPAYCEAQVIAGVLSGFSAFAIQLVVVDDASKDDTAAIAETFGAVVLRHTVDQGQGAALKTGIDYALSQGAAIIATFDADSQHDAQELMSMITHFKAHSELDILLGSRFLGVTSGMPFKRRLLLRMAIWFTRFTTGLALTDTHNGLRVLNRHAAEQIRLRQPRMAHASEILAEIATHQLRWAEYPVHIRYNAYSLGKGQRFGSMLRILIDLLRARLAQ